MELKNKYEPPECESLRLSSNGCILNASIQPLSTDEEDDWD